MSVALVKESQVAWTGGFGVCRGQNAGRVYPETIFAVASLSKPPFAQTVLRLCDRGLFDLDTPLAGFYQEPYDAYGLDPQSPELAQITARQVLCHVSGLGNWEEEDVGRVGFAPGTRWHYSGEGYAYLQAVLERVTGTPLAQLAEAEVFGPLEMRSTTYLWRRVDQARVSPAACSAEGCEFTRAVAASSLHTTALDYARFVAHMLHSEAGTELLAPQVQIDDSLAWGLGWGLAGDIFWHWGDMGGNMSHFQAAVVVSRSECQGLICLTNGENGLTACVEILESVFGDSFSYPIRAVLERHW